MISMDAKQFWIIHIQSLNVRTYIDPGLPVYIYGANGASRDRTEYTNKRIKFKIKSLTYYIAYMLLVAT